MPPPALPGYTAPILDLANCNIIPRCHDAYRIPTHRSYRFPSAAVSPDISFPMAMHDSKKHDSIRFTRRVVF